jgi:hypothetical protein
MKESREINHGYGMDVVDGPALTNPVHELDHETSWRVAKEPDPTFNQMRGLKAQVFNYILMIESRETRKQLKRLQEMSKKWNWAPWALEIVVTIDIRRFAEDF